MRTGLVCASLVLAGCRPQAGRVEGEWALQLTVTDPGGIQQARAGLRLQGTLVIDPRIPDTYSPEGERADSLGFTVGRVYLDRRPMYDSVARPRPYWFRPGVEHDIFEEARARVDSAGRLHARLSPGVTHTGITLQGTLSGDSAAGRWIHDGAPGQPGPVGTFRMWRTPRSSVTDSARVRSRRARTEWHRLRGAL